MDAKIWVEGVANDYNESAKNLQAAEEAYAAEPVALARAKRNKAIREMEVAKTRMTIAEAISEIVGCTEAGQITLRVPGVGWFQFQYGDFESLGFPKD